MLGLNTLRKMGSFTVHPSITIETIDIHPEPQNLAKYNKKHVESMANSQGAAGPAKQTEHTMPAEDTVTSKEKGYVSPDTNNLKFFQKYTVSHMTGWMLTSIPW